MSEPRYRYLKTSHEQEVLVLTPSPARLEGDQMAQALVDDMEAAVAHFKSDKVVVNLEHVQYLTSANFRPFLALRKRLQASGGRMVLSNLSPNVQDIFEVTRLISSSGSSSVLFEARPDVAAAVAHLLRRPESPAPQA